MMSPETIPAKPATKDDGRSQKPTQPRPPEQSLRCPRCDSPNTKFCYYNNYSLTQPRHFCKTCRRYWTKGGALRNVPIGGGCRKNKRGKSSSSSSGRLSAADSEGSDIGGLKFFHGLSPAMDFQFGGLAATNFPRYGTFGGDISIPQSAASTSLPCLGIENLGISNPLMGINFPIPSLMKQTGDIQEIGGAGGSMNVNSSLANSIESLSCINQDLHWKLQQQRLAMLFGGGGDNEVENQRQEQQQQQQTEKPQPIMFQNLDISKTAAEVTNCAVKDGGNIATEWFFDSSYAPMNPTPTNSSGNNANESTSNWSGMQTWSDMNQYI